MGMTALAGSRLRERRLLLGLRQADMARVAGISASYLNLIEHNRRRIGADLMEKLAAALGVEAAALAKGAGDALINDLRAAAGGVGTTAEIEPIEDFVSRFPGWAAVLGQTQRRAAQLERAVAALNDRIAHDPHLSQALHEMLSAVSAVRSTAAILAETDDIAPEWRARFHANLHGDSERLASGAEALVAYLDGSDQANDAGIASPQEEFDAWLAARGWHLAGLETGEGVEADLADLASGAARGLARDWIGLATADAAALPLAAFQAALAEIGPDPARLAARFGQPVLAVMRRLATLPGAQAGLVICDASGTLVFRKPAEGFVPPRFGAACALWPLYAALARPMTPVQAQVATVGRGGRAFIAQAFCQPDYPLGFAGPELRSAAMLMLPAASTTGQPLRIGATCRICPQQACPARRESSILSEASQSDAAP
ncbi:helix-turn-helix domain-containing protein [Rhodobacter ferrooxidans]|uniref:Transcriptional regulator, XRE family n=1 Tax=Rhodobacter ferrooxidans TaxID=371731 RepID=C8S0M6_9RHOB|nr:helix-turn-helix domain-containing protein [Rhodobacter sp. SW2]EEW25560.1 transcriptional regulator, XRE family [Rhodobacter sp. SW2]